MWNKRPKSERRYMKKQRKFWFSKSNILSGVAKWGVAQSPYHRPENLEVVIDKLDEAIKPFFEKEEFIEMPYQEIIDFVFKYTTAIPEFMAWNEAKINGGPNF